MDQPVGSRSRYIIGIDLGTTNTAVAYVDTRSAEQKVQPFELPQLVAPGALDRRRQLPSFVFLAGEHELAPAETELPWSGQASAAGVRVVVGELARNQGARQPERMIASAKSWLCHGGVDRHAAILPFGIETGPKLSPVAASAELLAHVKAAWDHVHARTPDARFLDQDVVLTVPASFDEAARELTLLAAQKAGLGPVVLLEEPQAAFYAWMSRNPARRRLRGGDRVLVFDVGGGTTDFTVIAVDADRSGFERTAVGDHLLLGGDNIDLTLAKLVEARLVAGGDGEARRLDPLQWHGLVHACRLAKETLLSNPDVETLPITVSGRSSRLIGSTLRAELGRAELERVLHDGFFPDVARDERPRRLRGGLQEFGLPYAADPAITRHLGAFITRHRITGIDAVLFNGGAMTPPALRTRVLDQIGRWQPERGTPRELVTRAPELAVAEGAAVYGLVRRGLGVRIGGGTPRAFYVGVGSSAGVEQAVCLAPKGIDEGSAVTLDRDFRLVTNRPVSFKLYSSSTRSDRAGTLVPLGPGVVTRAGGEEDVADLVELPPIVAALRAPGRKDVTVALEVRVTELGALEIWCRERAGNGGEPLAFRLVFDMRAGGAGAETGAAAAPGATDAEAGDGAAPAIGSVDPRVASAAAPLLGRLFAGPPDELARVMKLLEAALGAGRDAWNTATTRALFDVLFELEEQRKRSPAHEARWLHLCGFCLRPGTGAPLDDWRAKQMWRIFNEDLVHPRAEQSRLAWWITWRRIAGGLSKGQQHQIYLRLGQLFLPGTKSAKKWDELKPSPEEAAEMLRCLANLERLSPEAKLPLGDELVRRLESKRVREEGLTLWALARIGARVPLYGPINAVVPASKAAAWLDAIFAWPWPQPQKIAFSIAQIARRTGDRSRDLDDETRARIAAWLRAAGAERAAVLVAEVVALEAREEHIALGDTLPPGLHLVPAAAE